MNREEWNAYVKAHNGSFLQSWEWGEFQEQLGNAVHRLNGEGFIALLVRQRLPLGFRYWYAPYGPVLEDEGALQNFFDALTDLRIKDSRSVFVKIEPQSVSEEELRKGQCRSAAERQPTMTMIADLTGSEEVLFDALQKKVRYAVRKAEEYGVEIVRGSDLNEDAFARFWDLFSYTNSRHGLRTHSEEYFRTLLEMDGAVSTELFFARVEGECIAVALMLFWHDTAIYLYAGSRDGYGKYNAPSLLIWAAMKDAKRRGMKKFDFWGVSDTNPRWRGVTAFKRGFGGQEVRYAGTWDVVLRPFLYMAYRIARKYI